MSKHKMPEGNIIGFICNKCKRNFRVKEAIVATTTQCVYDDCKSKDIKRM
jgi:hypothetical protein